MPMLITHMPMLIGTLPLQKLTLKWGCCKRDDRHGVAGIEMAP